MTKKSALVHKLKNYDAEDQNRPYNHRFITMSNALTRAGHGLSLAEKRLVMMAVSSLDSRKLTTHGSAPTTRVNATDYAETFNVDLDTAYDQLQSGAKQLYHRSINFYEPAYSRSGRPLQPTMVTMRWVGQIHYQKGEGWVELYWWHKLVPHILGLRQQFTTYKLQQASALRSVYSWKLLELLTHFKSNGFAEYDIEDFCASMEATEIQRKNFAKIRIQIIEPAIKELQDKDNWDIVWHPIKAGRKVKKLKFTFRRNPQKRLFDD